MHMHIWVCDPTVWGSRFVKNCGGLFFCLLFVGFVGFFQDIRLWIYMVILLEGESREWETGRYFWISKSFLNMLFIGILWVWCKHLLRFSSYSNFYINWLLFFNVIVVCAVLERWKNELGELGKASRKDKLPFSRVEKRLFRVNMGLAREEYFLNYKLVI